MKERESDVVVGFFATRRQSMTVQNDLRRIGLADQDVDSGSPAPGRYSLDVHEAADLGSGALDGIVIGTVVGAVVGVGLLLIAVPQALELGTGAVVLGALIGAFWGSFFGGLAGMAIKATANEHGGQRFEIPDDSGVVAVVARAGAHVEATRKIMHRRGARILSPEMAGIELGSAFSPLSVDGALSDLEQSAAKEDEPRKIGVPRGAFLLLVLFLIAVSALWANVYLRVVWRA